jgi:hypothetical protein
MPSAVTIGVIDPTLKNVEVYYSLPKDLLTTALIVDSKQDGALENY